MTKEVLIEKTEEVYVCLIEKIKNSNKPEDILMYSEAVRECAESIKNLSGFLL